MAQDKHPASEPIQKAAQTAQTVRGAVKAGKAIAAAAKGAAAGGWYGAAAAFVWENRKLLAKILIAATALLMIPVILICMLPSIIFGGIKDAFSPNDPAEPVLNSRKAVTQNITDISISVSSVLSEGLMLTLEEIDADFTNSGADYKEIRNPYDSAPNYNANLFVGQYCAYKDQDYDSISVADMESILRDNKEKLYSYTCSIEGREVTETIVTVDAQTGKETETTTTTTGKWAVYTVSYNGEWYFAENVFHLNAEQISLANDYAYNLSLFLGDSMFQGLPAGYKTISSLENVRFTDAQTPVVYYNQIDERYASQPYGTDHIGGYGCGPTAMAIVVSSLTNDTVDPIRMANWSYENGYWCAGSGSYHTLIPAAAKAWGLKVEGCTAAEGQRIADALSSGKLVVAIMLKGHFTNSGHFIVLRGIRDGKILVADPASYERSKMTWELSLILEESCAQAGAGGPFWIIG